VERKWEEQLSGSMSPNAVFPNPQNHPARVSETERMRCVRVRNWGNERVGESERVRRV